MLLTVIATRIQFRGITHNIIRQTRGLIILALCIGITNIYYIITGLDFDLSWRCFDKYADTISRVTNACSNLLHVSAEIDSWITINQQINQKDIIADSDQDLKVIFIIGESHIKHHSSLYGYDMETNPLLQKHLENGNLIVFNDLVSTSFSTTTAVRNLLSTNDTSAQEPEEWYSKPYFPYLFKLAGWNVYLWDNQTTLPGKSDPLFFSLTAYLMNPFLNENCYNGTYTKQYPYDEGMIKDFKRNVSIDSTGRDLFIFHLIGQHIAFSDRYPDNFKRFSASDINRNENWLTEDKKTMIAHYDNATLYNDYVLDEIIKMYEDKNAIMIYISDHGEEVYDYRDSFGRKTCPENPGMNIKYLNEIPMIVWVSDIWKDRHPQILEDMTNAVNKPLLADNLCQMIMSVSGIKSDYYVSQRDILNDNYICNPRFVNDHSVNYDTLTITPPKFHI